MLATMLCVLCIAKGQGKGQGKGQWKVQGK